MQNWTRTWNHDARPRGGLQARNPTRTQKTRGGLQARNSTPGFGSPMQDREVDSRCRTGPGLGATTQNREADCRRGIRSLDSEPRNRTARRTPGAESAPDSDPRPGPPPRAGSPGDAERSAGPRPPDAELTSVRRRSPVPCRLVGPRPQRRRGP